MNEFLPALSPDFLALQAGVFLAAFVAGLSGFAFALVATGIIYHLRPPAEATALVLAASFIAQVLAILRLRYRVLLSDLLPFLLPGLVGVPIGSVLLGLLDPSWVKLGVGLFLVAYSVYAVRLPSSFVVSFAGKKADAAVGFLSGVLGGLAGLSGALMTAWCLMRGWEPARQRSVFQSFILVMQAYGLASLALFVGVKPRLVSDILAIIPTITIGVMIGLWLFVRLDGVRFRRLVLWLLLFLGAALVVGELSPRLT